MKEDPTKDNISKETKELNKKFSPYSYISEPSDFSKSHGAILAIPGGGRCPWCASPMEELEERNFIAVCKKDKRHIVEWRPWGG